MRECVYEPLWIKLSAKCPKCNNKLLIFLHAPASDSKELGWECLCFPSIYPSILHPGCEGQYAQQSVEWPSSGHSFEHGWQGCREGTHEPTQWSLCRVHGKTIMSGLRHTGHVSPPRCGSLCMEDRRIHHETFRAMKSAQTWTTNYGAK